MALRQSENTSFGRLIRLGSEHGAVSYVLLLNALLLLLPIFALLPASCLLICLNGENPTNLTNKTESGHKWGTMNHTGPPVGCRLWGACGV